MIGIHILVNNSDTWLEANILNTRVGHKMSALAETILKQLPQAGSLIDVLPNTTLMRVDEIQPLTPLIYNPSIFFVAQGEKEAWLEEERFVYNKAHYLLLTIPLPLRCRVFNANPDEPFLAVRLNINLPVLNDLLTKLPEHSMPMDQSKRGIFISEATDILHDGVTRLLSTLENPSQQSILAPMCYREILFHILQGPEAQLLRDFATADRQNNRIALAINYIHQNYRKNIHVDDLANIAAMSSSTFFEHFKNVTDHSPLQYLKNIRLHHAKHQIFNEQLPVSEAAYNVGYESASQFSREYKRLFGLAPSKHIQATNPVIC